MKKLFMVLVLAILATSIVAAAEYPVLDKQIEIRKNHIKWMSEVKKIGMDATIDYFDGINGSTEELESIKEDFEEQESLILGMDTHVGLNNGMRELRTITGTFRKETMNQLRQTPGKPMVLAAEIVTALDEHKDELDAFKDAYWDLHEENSLEIFDLRVERAETILSKLEDHGYNISEAEAKLDEIKAKKTDLESAFEERDLIQIAAVHLEIFELSKELGEIVRDLQVEVPPRIRARHWIFVGERVVERTGVIISDLDELGIDVSELEEIHGEADELLEEAKDAFDSNQTEEAIDTLKEFRDKLEELKEAYSDLVFGDMPEVEALVEANEEALEEVVSEMN